MAENGDNRILIVDDDELSRRMLVRTLTSAGYVCGDVKTSLEAWQCIHQHEYALVLLDLVMPDLDGAGLLKKIRAESNPTIAQMPVIMLTGHTGEESEVL